MSQETIRPVKWTLPIITLVGVAAAIVTAFFGSGALGGTPVSEAAGGALSADATPVAPAGSAFSIWSVIYLGLAAYALWQLTPTARRSSRQRALRPWALLSALLNAAWIWAVQFDLLIGSVVVIVLLLAVLIRIMFILGAPRTGGWLEVLLVDGTFGLYMGWVSVATLANTYALLVAEGIELFRGIPLGVVGIVVAAGIGVATALISRGRIAPGLATAWGLAWVAVGRTEGQYESQVLVWTAAVAAAVVLLVAVLTRVRSGARIVPQATADATAPEERSGIVARPVRGN
ncbi:tryptophan-rich sensory protein [Corynebacterium halotolerans]|uniref:Tryptophan-rich sensory protein n=1 Tax=Corynebacterium halotolerans YIM 70093 = DSM 44683 TaxID=1121362 RepID=M1P0F6_9CORY|nr:tryptophan-rich sensory protein [Corynebacterium halotolerans]AGF73265.1 hypothetical protein A605_11325 [Corynebacterium halotolerans YIM 70093 = DSM 44683]